MLKSMTGFGRAEQNVGDKTFLVDIKSLNGKQFDLQLKMPAFLKPFEFDIRRILSDQLGRGTVDCTISLKETGNAKPVTINTDLARAYYQPLATLSKELGLDTSTILSTLIKLPEVITPSSETLTDDEWKAFAGIIKKAIENLNYHREEEGKVLKIDLELLIEEKKAIIKCDRLPIVNGNPLQLNQLFLNLFSNSLKSSPVKLESKCFF